LDSEVLQAVLRKKGTGLSNLETFGPRIIIASWHGLRKAYITRSLIIASDRLLAMFGIAARYDEVFQDRY